MAMRRGAPSLSIEKHSGFSFFAAREKDPNPKNLFDNPHRSAHHRPAVMLHRMTFSENRRLTQRREKIQERLGHRGFAESEFMTQESI
jgi:hypothetical protein